MCVCEREWGERVTALFASTCQCSGYCEGECVPVFRPLISDRLRNFLL